MESNVAPGQPLCNLLPENHPMKTYHPISLACMFALTILRAEAGFLFPEDAIGKDYWRSLDPKSKIVFLTAYRHGQGPIIDINAKPPFQVLATGQFPALIAKLDKFYQTPGNQHVFLSAAIRISFMEMSDKPQAEIDEAINQARRALAES
jgi:hypothetical protein